MILTFWNKFSLALYKYKEKKKEEKIPLLPCGIDKTFSGRYGEQTVYFILWLFFLVQKLLKTV